MDARGLQLQISGGSVDLLALKGERKRKRRGGMEGCIGRVFLVARRGANC